MMFNAGFGPARGFAVEIWDKSATRWMVCCKRILRCKHEPQVIRPHFYNICSITMRSASGSGRQVCQDFGITLGLKKPDWAEWSRSCQSLTNPIFRIFKLPLRLSINKKKKNKQSSSCTFLWMYFDRGRNALSSESSLPQGNSLTRCDDNGQSCLPLSWLSFTDPLVAFIYFFVFIYF